MLRRGGFKRFDNITANPPWHRWKPFNPRPLHGGFPSEHQASPNINAGGCVVENKRSIGRLNCIEELAHRSKPSRRNSVSWNVVIALREPKGDTVGADLWIFRADEK